MKQTSMIFAVLNEIIYVLNEINLWFLIGTSHLKSSPDYELRTVNLKCKIDWALRLSPISTFSPLAGSFLNDPTNFQNLRI